MRTTENQGYCTIYSDLHNEVAWRDIWGNPIIYRSEADAQEELDDDAKEWARQVAEGKRRQEEVPEKDIIAWAVRIDDTRWQIQDLDKQDLFVWDLNNF